jgi:hypothetical protein
LQEFKTEKMPADRQHLPPLIYSGVIVGTEIHLSKDRAAICDAGQLPNIKINKRISNSFMSNTHKCLGVEYLNKTQKRERACSLVIT